MRRTPDLVDRDARFERIALITGAALILVALAGSISGGLWTLEGDGRRLGCAGLLSLALSALSAALRRYRAGARASLPVSVGRTRVPVRPSRAFAAVGVSLAIVLPLAVAVAALLLVDWAWALVACVVLLGGSVAWLQSVEDEEDPDREPPATDPRASGALERLSIIADLPVPGLVVEPQAIASAWTQGGRIHLTAGLLELLTDRELEAVLAHELGHLARRDAPVMEVCSAPSRVLLTFAWFLTPRLGRWTWRMAVNAGSLGLTGALYMWIVAVVCVPPALLFGGIARLSVLGMSRAREFAADAAAVVLTGRPSALASALKKLERQGDWMPAVDLRAAGPDAVLCIVAPAPPPTRFGRLLATHPPVAERVRRLHELESRLQQA